MLEEQFALLGYSEKEAKVYLALNRFGASLASTLARLAGVKRTSIYDILNSLQAKNLITSYQQGKYTYYAIDDLRKIYWQEKEKSSVAQNLVESLKQNQRFNQGIQIHHYRGKDGFIEMYEDILNFELKEVCIWVNLDFWLKVVSPEQDHEWTLRRVKKGVKARILMQTSKMARDFQSIDQKYQRSTKFLPPHCTFKTTCILFQNHLALFDPTEMTGIRIFNPALYQMQQQIFELNWLGKK